MQPPADYINALATLGDQQRGLAAGLQAYIAKPIEPEGFAAAIEPLLNTAPDRRAA